jgi:hypothetical protein
MKCANCGHEISLVDDRKGAALMDCIRMSGRFGQASNLVFEYALLRLGGRSIKDQELKLSRILEGLLGLWEGGKFGFRPKGYQISQAGILTAMKTVCDRGLKGPLENDNYLKKVMVDIAEKEEKGRSLQGERDLREKEKGLRAGRYDGHPDQPPRTTDEPDYALGKEMISGILKTI